MLGYPMMEITRKQWRLTPKCIALVSGPEV